MRIDEENTLLITLFIDGLNNKKIPEKFEKLGWYYYTREEVNEFNGSVFNLVFSPRKNDVGRLVLIKNEIRKRIAKEKVAIIDARNMPSAYVDKLENSIKEFDLKMLNIYKKVNNQVILENILKRSKEEDWINDYKSDIDDVYNYDIDYDNEYAGLEDWEIKEKIKREEEEDRIENEEQKRLWRLDQAEIEADKYGWIDYYNKDS